MFDLDALTRAVAEHGRVARVVVAAVSGSAPREVGAAMLVWDGGQHGTIGGGALELAAAQAASHRQGLTRHPLGPSLGQCCGGSVVLLTEHYDACVLAELSGRRVIARGPGDPPLAVSRVLDRARARGEIPRPRLFGEWMVEPVLKPSRALWVWGAGHVGRAIVAQFAPLPEFDITWVDTGTDRFPVDAPENIRLLPSTQPESVVRLAPTHAEHLILTYSHAMDLALCHALLSHGFSFAGLIGSDTKWARFRKRLQALGHERADILRICCPIGQKTLGKHPQAIAIGVAGQLLNRQQKDAQTCQTRSSA